MSTPKKKNRHNTLKIRLILGIVILGIVLLAGIVFVQYSRRNLYSAAIGSKSGTTVKEDKNIITYQDKKYRYNDHLSNFLFMGVDSRSTEKNHAGQADAIFLMSWDRVKHSLRTISIPRDTMTDIEVFNFNGKSLGLSRDHLSLAYAFGDGKTGSCELVKDAVSRLFSNIPIQGYCSVNMDGISTLVDTIGGVAITLPDDSMADVDPSYVQGSEVLITGENAETFLRHRDTDQSQSALVRQSRQDVFLKAYGEKAFTVQQEDPSFVTKLYENMQEYMVTNIGNDVFLKISDDVLSNGNRESYTVPGEGAAGEYFDEFEVDEDALYDLVIRVFYEEA